ncbi:MAG: DUF2147 domain-containing protein [Fibrobacterales bacterium]
MLKKVTLITLLSSIMLISASKDDFLGKWFTKDNESIVELFQKKNKIYGVIRWLKDPLDSNGIPKVDSNNPDTSLRNTPIIDLEILKDFEFDDDELEEGTVYDPNNGKTYSCEMKIQKSILKVRGYIGFSLIGRTAEWVRVPQSFSMETTPMNIDSLSHK